MKVTFNKFTILYFTHLHKYLVIKILLQYFPLIFIYNTHKEITNNFILLPQLALSKLLHKILSHLWFTVAVTSDFGRIAILFYDKFT